MADNIEELFGRGAGTPKPRLVRVWLLMVAGLLTAILGLACLSAPGGVLVLLAIMAIEKEKDRIDNGYLPETDRAQVMGTRMVAYLALMFCTVLFFLQCWLYSEGFYAALGDLFFLGEPPDWVLERLAPA